MSFQAMTWATEQDVPAMQKIVLLMLANRTNDDTGQCNPSHEKLASDCGMSVRACKDQLSRLEAAGLLTIIRRQKEGVSLPNQYVLHTYARGQEMPTRGQQMPEGSAAGARGVVQQVPTKQEVEPGIEPIKTKTKRSVAAPSFDPLNFLLGNGVEKQIAMDWLQVRRAKRAANTETAFADVLAKITAAGMPYDDALRLCCSRGWAGFDASWLEKRQQARPNDRPAKFDPVASINNQARKNYERTIDIDQFGEPV